jgi:predicted amidophosphoribosyltransferase
MLRAIRPSPPLDVRELIIQTSSTAAAHGQDVRPRPEDLVAVYRVDPALIAPTPQVILLCDDVLTTGCHYRAAHTVLRSAFPGVSIIGLFIARRVPEAVDFEDFDEL